MSIGRMLDNVGLSSIFCGVGVCVLGLLALAFGTNPIWAWVLLALGVMQMLAGLSCLPIVLILTYKGLDRTPMNEIWTWTDKKTCRLIGHSINRSSELEKCRRCHQRKEASRG